MDDNDKEAIQMAEKKNPTLKKARYEMTYLTGDEAVQRLQDLRDKWEMDRISALDFAEEKGIEKGIEKGRKEGEQQNKKEIAKKMLVEKIDINTIIKITGLTKEEIEKL